MSRISEQDEFLLSRLLDGDLPADQATSLRERMAREPALREAMNALTRIDGLLSRRGTHRPDIDWRQFRQDVLGRIDQEASPSKTLRLARWMWLGAPLAAAAAIALMLVTLYYPTQHAQPGVPMAAKPDSGILAVRFNRPETMDKIEPIQVSYKQSTDLAEAMQKRDRGYRSRPAGHMYVAEKPPPVMESWSDSSPL